MNFKVWIYLSIVMLFNSISCASKSSDDEEKLKVMAGLIVTQVAGPASSVATSSTIACSNSAPTFSTLSSAGVNSSCGKSGCHAGASPQQGLDMTSYSSVLSKVTPKNGSGSLLFQKINGGTMQVYTTSAITNAIYCWIQGGALP